MKKRIVLLLVLSFLFAFMPPAMAATLDWNVSLNRSEMTLSLSGSCSESLHSLTFYVSDSAKTSLTTSDLYAMEQCRTDENGSFDLTVKLPPELPYGEYRVTAGGLGTGIPVSERSKTFQYESLANFSLWLEAEKDAELSGNYQKLMSSVESSAGGRIYVDTTDQTTENKAVFSFELPAEGDYDFWVLSTSGNQTYVTKYLYALDGNTPEENTNAALQKAYITKDVRQVPVYWSKLTDVSLSAGSHTLTFTANAVSELNGFILHELDAVVIVPKEWNWSPNGFHSAYNVNAVKLDCTAAECYTNEADRGGSAEVYLTTVLREKTIHNATVWAAIVKNGELVSSAVKDTKIQTSNMTVGQEVETQLNIAIPSFAPDGEYEIWCGMGGAMGNPFSDTNCPKTADGYVRAGTFRIGSAAAPNPESVSIQSVSLDVKRETVTANYKLADTNVTENEKAFLKLWKDDVLWGVAESEDLAVVSDTGEHSVTLNLPVGIPEDTYTAEFGFYHVNGTKQAGNIQTSINGKYGYKPLSNGVYQAKKTGRNHFWYVSQENTLIWDGEPYIPIGGMECPDTVIYYSQELSDNENNWAKDKQELEYMIANGVTDLYINPTGGADNAPGWVWEYLFSFLEEHGVRYGLQTNGAKNQMVDSFYIRSNVGAIEVTNVTSGGRIEKLANVPIYGRTESASGYYTLINSADRAVKTGECRVEWVSGEQYRFTADISLPSQGTYKVVFTPKLRHYNNLMCNFWDSDAREENLEYAKIFGDSVPMGDNFRCIVDPLSNESGYYNVQESMRPYSADYNALYKKWLQEKYTSVAQLLTAWNTSGISDFETASRLIPVYTAANNQSDYAVYAADPETNRIYTLGGRTGVMWTDYLTFRDESTAEFYNAVCDAYKKTADVPIVVKNVWGHKEYFINKNQKGGLDGLGAEAYGSAGALRNLQASCYGMGQQFGKTAWLIVTETETEEQISVKYESGEYGYGTEQNMHGHFDALLESGAKGIFDFLYSAHHSEMIHKAYSYMYNPEMFAWAKNYRNALNVAETADYVPPEHKVYTMPHHSNWYTNPNRYNAVMYDDDYTALWAASVQNGMMLLPVETADVPGEILAASFQNGPASQAQGKAFGKMMDTLPAEKQAVYLGFRKDLGTVPQVDQYFTNSYSVNQSGTRVQVLKPTATAEIIRTTADGKPWVIRDGNLWIISAEDAVTSSTVSYLSEIGIFMQGSDLVWRDPVLAKQDDHTWVGRVQVKNNQESYQDAEMYLASYSNGRLTGVKRVCRRLYPGLNELSASISVQDSDTEVRAYFWDFGMKPIRNQITN